jgi:hypothetical protein
MSNLLALPPKAAPLVSIFFAEMSKKRQRCTVIYLENNFSISAKFTDVYCNCNQQLFQNKNTCAYQSIFEKLFDKTKDEVALLICFLFD